MKRTLLSLTLMLISSSAFAGGFNECYSKAYQSLSNIDSVKMCVNAGNGFSDCYSKAYQSLSNIDSVKACRFANEDFSDCYSKAYQSLSNIDSVKLCAQAPWRTN